MQLGPRAVGRLRRQLDVLDRSDQAFARAFGEARAAQPGFEIMEAVDAPIPFALEIERAAEIVALLLAQLRAFGTATCNLPPAVTAEAMSQVAEAVADVRSDLAVAGGVGAAMLTQWESGLHSTHSKSVTVATPAEQDKTPEPPKAGRGR